LTRTISFCSAVLTSWKKIVKGAQKASDHGRIGEFGKPCQKRCRVVSLLRGGHGDQAMGEIDQVFALLLAQDIAQKLIQQLDVIAQRKRQTAFARFQAKKRVVLKRNGDSGRGRGAGNNSHTNIVPADKRFPVTSRTLKKAKKCGQTARDAELPLSHHPDFLPLRQWQWRYAYPQQR
jgi:hypothetical protein